MNDKIEYLAKSFSKTTGKKYEHYVITAIYHKINNFELKPVTQQLVYSSKDPTKYYFLDLYFPQIEYGVEIDEPAHNREEYAAADLERAEDIMGAIGCDERHVKINKDSTVEDINQQIDEIVQEVKNIISNRKEQLEWIPNEKLMEDAFKRRELSAGDGIHYKNYTAIWEKFTGEKLNHNRRCYAKNRRLPGDYILWVPRAKIEVNGMVYGDINWDNIIGEDGGVITERGARKKPLDIGKVVDGEKRIVFMHVRDEFNSDKVVFLGCFQHTNNEDENTAVYKRISETYEW